MSRSIFNSSDRSISKGSGKPYETEKGRGRGMTATTHVAPAAAAHCESFFSSSTDAPSIELLHMNLRLIRCTCLAEGAA